MSSRNRQIMKCEEAAEFVSALCDGASIPPVAAGHVGACETCQARLKEYGEIGMELRSMASAELRRVASLESPEEVRARIWETTRRTTSSSWKKAWKVRGRGVYPAEVSGLRRQWTEKPESTPHCGSAWTLLAAKLPLIVWLYAVIFAGLFMFLLWVGRHHDLLTAILLQARNEIIGITMPPLILTIIVFVTVVLVVFSSGAAAVTPTSVLGARLRALGGLPAMAQEKVKVRERIEQALDPLSKAIPLSPSDVSRTRAWLIQAGLRESRHVSYYFGARIMLALLGLAGVILFSGFDSVPMLVCVPAFGFFLPRFFLKRMIKDRQRRIRIGLPDALDLTVICVEAGLALDQALMRVGKELHHAYPDLSDEFHLVNLEMRAGKPRAEALRNLVDRTGVDDVRSLVGTLIQTDRFGTSVAQALRVHSDSLRTARRQRAEEQAAKTTIKMIPPLVVFILVPFLFVTIGPALIQAYHALVSK